MAKKQSIEYEISDEEMEEGYTEYTNQSGLFHRENGPAIVDITNGLQWYRNGFLHRDNGPAVIEFETDDTPYVEKWYKNGLLHRDGKRPAINDFNFYQEWWYNGKRHNLLGPAIVDGEDQQWFINGKKHRKGKPAVIQKIYNGYIKRWYIDDLLHRDNGPAVVSEDNRQKNIIEKWYRYGKKHKISGPAIIDIEEDIEEWWLNGVEYSEEDHKDIVDFMKNNNLFEDFESWSKDMKMWFKLIYGGMNEKWIDR